MTSKRSSSVAPAKPTSTHNTRARTASKARVLDSTALPPLPTGAVTEPKFDGMRLCLRVDWATMEKVEMKDALGVPLVPGAKENTWENVPLGLFVKWAGGSLWIQLHGRFFGYTETSKEALSKVLDIALSAEGKFGQRPHLTQVVSNRDLPGIAPLEVLPLPSASVHWNFLGERITPTNQFGGIWVHSKGEWAIRTYDKAMQLRKQRCRHEGLAEHLERQGVNLSAPMARVEVEMRGKVGCAGMTNLLYRSQLTPYDVFEAWVRKRSIREAKPTANLSVKDVTKSKHWPVCKRFLEVMLVNGPRRTPTNTPKMKLYERPLNEGNRARALAAACVQKGLCIEDAVSLLRQEWESARQARAEELADRVASKAYIGRSDTPDPQDGRREAAAGVRKPAGAEADGGPCSHPGIGTTSRSDLSPRSGGEERNAITSLDHLECLKAKVRANPTSKETRAELAEAWHLVLKAWEQSRERKVAGERLARTVPVRATTIKV
jgi:hypothetical protein